MYKSCWKECVEGEVEWRGYGDSKERVGKDGAGAFLLAVDGELLLQLVGDASNQEMRVLKGCWWRKIMMEGDGKS